MGVTYKLKKEVVDFILQQKKTNPAISCRKLAAVAGETFQINVSKSSINAVIKEASLSCPVGRRPQEEKAAQKFKIPIQRKEQLFPGQAIPLGYSRPEPLPPVEIKEKILPSKAADSMISVPQKAKATLEEPDKEKKSDPRPATKAIEKSEKPKIKDQVTKTPIYDRLGTFILKAAQWQLSESSILGSVLGKINSGYSQKDMNEIAEVFLFLKAFGIEKFKDLGNYKENGLWFVSGSEQKIPEWTFDKIQEIFNKKIKDILLLMSNECGQKFFNINFFKLSTYENKEFFIDSKLITLHKANNVHADFKSPLNAAMQKVSNNFLGNNFLKFLYIPGEYSFTQQFYDLVDSLDRIKEIGIYDNQQNEITSFRDIPWQKRFFIAGVFPWQEEMKRFLEKSENKYKSIKLPDFIGKNEVFCSSGMSKLGPVNQDVRYFLIKDKESESPRMALLTNNLEMDPEKILLEYFFHWPRPEETYQTHSELLNRPPHPNEDEFFSFEKVKRLDGHVAHDFLNQDTNFSVVVELLLSAIQEYCLVNYFPASCQRLHFSTMIERFYGLPGVVTKAADVWLISLKASLNYAHKAELEYALNRLNEADIRNEQNKKIRFEVSFLEK